MSYIGVIQSMATRLGPWFLHNPNIASFLESVAATLDTQLTELDIGLRLSQPLRCDPSAFPYLSRDRGIRLYSTEAEISKRTRLAQWLKLHRQRGTHQGEMRHAAPYFLPDTPILRIVHQDGAGNRATWHTLNPDGSYTIHKAEPSNWNYDGQTEKWSRWWVICYAPTRLFDLSHWDDGSTWDDGSVWDGMTTQVALDLINMFLEWQAAHSQMKAFIIATDPASFNPSATATTDPAGWTSLPVGNWGSPVSPGPVSVMTRLPSAFWIYEAA